MSTDMSVLPDHFQVDRDLAIWWDAVSKYVAIIHKGVDFEMTMIATLRKGRSYLRLKSEEGFFISSSGEVLCLEPWR